MSFKSLYMLFFVMTDIRTTKPWLHNILCWQSWKQTNQIKHIINQEIFLLSFRRFMRELWLALWLFSQSCHLRTCVNCVFIACNKMHVNVLPITSIRESKSEQQLNYCKSWAFKKETINHELLHFIAWPSTMPDASFTNRNKIKIWSPANNHIHKRNWNKCPCVPRPRYEMRPGIWIAGCLVIVYTHATRF